VTNGSGDAWLSARTYGGGLRWMGGRDSIYSIPQQRSSRRDRASDDGVLFWADSGSGCPRHFLCKVFQDLDL